MSESQVILCPHCRAEQFGPSDNCWLCHKPLAASGEQVPTLPVPDQVQPHEPERFSFSLATMFLFTTLIAVCLGLFVTLPGVGIFASIVLVPVFIRTARVVRYRESLGEVVSPAEKTTLFLGSFMVSSILVIVVGVAAFCSFCGVCMAVFSAGEVEMLPFALGILFLAFVSIVATIRLARWSRHRWRRDMGQE